MVYQLSCEEHKYLPGIRWEKELFEWLIKEWGYVDCLAGDGMEERMAAASVVGAEAVGPVCCCLVTFDRHPVRFPVDSSFHPSSLLAFRTTEAF
jgi:hypothetical protein